MSFIFKTKKYNSCLTSFSPDKLVLSLCLLISSLFFITTSYSQVKFSPELFEDPKMNGAMVSGMMKTVVLPKYADTAKNCIYLKFGFQSSKFTNEADWLVIKDNIEPYRIDIVYSKYPIKNGFYNEIYSLLFARMKSLFEMDPYLNDATLEWNKVLQTNCIDNEQVNTLFHGVAIWYRPMNKEIELDPKKELELEQNSELIRINPSNGKPGVETVRIAKTDNLETKEKEPDQSTLEEVSEAIKSIKSFSFIPDSLVKTLSNKPLDQQINTLRKYLEEDIANDPESSLKNATKEEILMYQKEVENFLLKFPAKDNVVQAVLDRHPEWKNAIVINDWTGSMYGYGAQVLLWHVTNFQKSGITSITLFNDGDNKSNFDKKIAETGGIYSESPDNVLTLEKTFNYVMLKGMGGDGPENNIEAILKAMETTPFHSEIILIADNNACIRDLELVEFITEPVKVIVCGYEPEKGINPDLVYLAKKTNGGLFTLTDDIENINIEYDFLGLPVSLLDNRFILSSQNCGQVKNRNNDYTSSLYGQDEGRYDIQLESETNTNLKTARFNKKDIRQLIITDKAMKEIPSYCYKMRNLTYLNLSKNEIESLSSKFKNLRYLRIVNLSFNKLSSLPSEIKENLFIENLDLSYNKLTELPSSILSMKFLKILNLSHNQISIVDPAIKLKKIEKLNLSNNKLKELPKEIGTMKRLKTLNLSDNQLGELPSALCNITNLQILNLKNNKLTKLPPLLYKMKKLKVLNLENNNLSEEEKNRIKSVLTETKIYF